MKLPNFSYMVKVGQIRAIQARYEQAEHRNPDSLAYSLLPMSDRLGANLRGRFFLQRMRSQPFYAFVLARTRYYDAVFLDAINSGVQFIVNIGCGTDTRAIRFARELAAAKIEVIEMDQAEAIETKQSIISRQRHESAAAQYLAVDLNDDTWTKLADWIEQHRSSRVLIMLEGVSPYIQDESFDKFLRFLSAKTASGSLVAYDFKRPDVKPDFGRSDRTREPFRLPFDRAEVTKFHAERGLQLQSLETSAELTMRLAPVLARHAATRFEEDCMVRLTVRPA